MAKLKIILRDYFIPSTILFWLVWITPAMSYEEPAYEVIKKTDIYEIRLYEKRIVAQIEYRLEGNGFRILFDYISGANQNSEKVQMTIPVTQSKEKEKMLMQFFLPNHYSKENTPNPSDERIKIIALPEEHFAVITYSGFSSESNFRKYLAVLRENLKKHRIIIKGLPVKATYNAPFTLPFLRRNEAMFPIEWN